MSEIIDKPSENLIEPGIFARDKDLAKRASAIGTKRRKELKKERDFLAQYLALDAPDKIKEKLKAHFPKLGKISNRIAYLLSLIAQAQAGNTRAAKIIIDAMDGMPNQPIELSGTTTVRDNILVKFVHTTKDELPQENK